MICALMLLLPLPVPFSNIIPAWGIMLIAGGLLERDGAFIIAGYVASLLTIAFFAAIAHFRRRRRWISSGNGSGRTRIRQAQTSD